MKKFIAVLLLLVLPYFCYAADTVTQTLERLNSLENSYKWVLTVTDDADDNVAITAMDTTIYNKLKGWYMYQVTWDPGATQPDATVDLVFTTSGGTENLAGTDLDNRSATLTQKVVLGNFYCLDELIYFSTTGQTINNALYVVEVVFVR